MLRNFISNSVMNFIGNNLFKQDWIKASRTVNKSCNSTIIWYQYTVFPLILKLLATQNKSSARSIPTSAKNQSSGAI